MKKKDLKEKYDVTCPVCGHEFIFAPSWAMKDFGMLDKGHGTCSECKTFLHLSIVDGRGCAEPWTAFVERETKC